MSPTNFTPGRSAVKSRLTRSGTAGAASASASVVTRNGRGWHGTRSSWRMMLRTSSGEHCVPSAARSAWIRRYPYVPSASSKKCRIRAANTCLRAAVAESGRESQS